jgi:iron complex outermembrane receptor protein
MLTLQVAGRYEMLKTRGANVIDGVLHSSVNDVDSADPTVALLYQPLRKLAFRASYGTGFLPPDASALGRGTPVTIPGRFFGYTDPRRGGELLSGDITVDSGGSDSLRPEHSRVVSAGLIWNPSSEDIRVSADWIQIEKWDGITSIPVSQENLNNEAFLPDFIEREPAPAGDPFGVGRISRLNSYQRNIAGERREMVDLEIDATKRTLNLGAFSFRANATYLLHSQSQLAPEAPVVENSGLVEGLRWRANSTISWSYRSYRLGWTAHFLSGYWLNADHEINLNQGAAKVSSLLTHDPFVQWSSAAGGGSPWAGLSIQAGVRNVFNRAPQTDTTSILTGAAFINPLADPMGATYYLWLRKKF